MYHKKAHIHFVGIGGIGMSGIAHILRHQGYSISGCDTDCTQKSVQELIAIGCLIYPNNNSKQCNNQAIDIVVYSSAIADNNPELIAARKRGIPTIRRALMLAELMRTKHAIAVAGSHGKTTTTSLISHILIEAGLDPTVIIGGILKNISGGARLGSGDFLVAEADESDRTFLHLHATLAIITNIDLEHLETYKDLNDVKQTFIRFINNLPFYGKAIVCIDDENVRSILPIAHIKTVTYGLSTNADLYGSNIQLEANYSTFTVYKTKQENYLGTIKINMPGRHNVLNALGAIALALDLEIPFTTIAQAIEKFKGIERRFCYRGTFNGSEIFDDYGHHPKEIACTLEVAQKRSKNKLRVIFQPHRYSRTHKLWDTFIATFLNSKIHQLIITDIYPASEAPIANITAHNLAKAIEQRHPPFKVTYLPYEAQFDSIRKEITRQSEPNDLLLLLGAGKLNQIIDYLN